MNLSKPRKKRRKSSEWIISEPESSNAKVSHHGGFTVYESNAFVLAIPGKNTHNITKIGKYTEQRKKNHGCRRLPSTNLKQIPLDNTNKKVKCNDNIIHTSYENKNFKNMNCITFESDYKSERIYYENEMVDNGEDNGINEISDSEEGSEQAFEGEESNNGQENCHENSNAYDKNNAFDNEESGLFEDELVSSDFDSSDDRESKEGCDLIVENSVDKFKQNHNLENLHSVHNKIDYIHQLYNVENEKKYILHLPCYKKFYFQGKLQITLLYGDIEVFGYKLNHMSKNKTLQLYSPRRCMQLDILSKLPQTTLTPLKLEEILGEYLKISENDFENLSHSFQANDALILVERLFSPYSLMLDHYCDIDFFLRKEIVQGKDCVEKDLDCLLNRTDVYERKGFTVGKDWNCIKPVNCTIICGGKGVGKSTLLKFLVNCELSRKEAVLCIDLDPGQSEFTTPGCVSAVVVKKPLLGPSFTHITTPRKMAFIGVVNVALDPVRYMKAVNYIVKSCREDPELSDLPWFVNTMGFNKGIGLDFIVNIIKLLKPDGVVQIYSSDKSRNYKFKLNPAVVQRYSVLSMLPVDGEDLKYTLYTLNSCSRSKGLGFQGGFRPAELREFMILSYFSPLLSLPFCSLNAVQPRWIHFSRIFIAVNDLVQLNYILKAINGNLVALSNISEVKCTVKSVATTNANNCFLKVAIHPEIAPSFGIGLVRGIDCDQEKIYIITPISNEELENVNCLHLGSIDPPSSFYLKQKYISEPVVYTDIRDTRNVRSLRHTFRYIPDFQKNQTNRQC